MTVSGDFQTEDGKKAHFKRDIKLVRYADWEWRCRKCQP